MNPVRLLISTFAAVLLMLAGARAQNAYVTQNLTNSVSVIDTSTNTVVAVVPVGMFTAGVAITPDGSRAYVANEASNSVSVIDTSSNSVVATVPVLQPQAVAITPDGSRAYVTDGFVPIVSAIDTSTNTVVAVVPVGTSASGVAITPDGSRAYVTHGFSNSVSVIDTSSNTVVDTSTGFDGPSGLAITLDGSRAYVTNVFSNSVSVIDTSSNTVVDTLTGFDEPFAVAITPDGSRAYVMNFASEVVSVIDIPSNTLVATIMVGSPVPPTNGIPLAGTVAFTPDGTRAYVITAPGDVSVIDTSSNTVVATVPSGGSGVAIVPPVHFSAFSTKVDISSAGFDLQATATLGTRGTINPPAQPLTLRVGTYTVTVPAGSFKTGPKGTFTFEGTINGVALQIRIVPLGGNSYSVQVDGSGVDLTGLTNPVTVTLTVGNNTGTTPVNADF